MKRITYRATDLLGIVITQEWTFAPDATIPETMPFAGLVLRRVHQPSAKTTARLFAAGKRGQYLRLLRDIHLGENAA